MDDGRPAILLSEGHASWRGLRGYVEDISEAIALCVVSEQKAGRTYHVADKNNLTEADWVERIARAAGWNGKVVVLPDDRLPCHLKHDYDYSRTGRWTRRAFEKSWVTWNGPLLQQQCSAALIGSVPIPIGISTRTILTMRLRMRR